MSLRSETLIRRLPVLLLGVCLASTAFGQHRGDNLAFQGLDLTNRSDVKATAMGGSMVGRSGDVGMLHWNPAGLRGLSGLQFSINSSSFERTWRERQDYRPNRQVVTLSFILDGLYRPDPRFNGEFDNEVFFADSNYIVNDPILGEDGYSEASADWQQVLDDAGLNNISAALPVTVGKWPVVIAAGYNRRLMPLDFDRNETHLDPVLAYDGYGLPPARVTGAGDSVRVNWSEFGRSRTGPLDEISGALAVELHENISLGLGIQRLGGETSDSQQLNRIGTFDLVQGIQIYRFSYDTLSVTTRGTSSFSATRLNLGAQLSLQKLNIGFTLTPGYTISRDWDLVTATATPTAQTSQSSTGTDEMSVPTSFAFGVGVQPHPKFDIAFDVEHRPYSKTEFRFATPDSSHRQWADQTRIRVGLQYELLSGVSLLGGFRSIPQTFIPDGAADLERGPAAESYSFGMSINLFKGRLDAAYEIRTLRYYDVYFSNTNWAYERVTNFMAGYTFQF